MNHLAESSDISEEAKEYLNRLVIDHLVNT